MRYVRHYRYSTKNFQKILKVARNMYNSLIILWKFERILTNTIVNICRPHVIKNTHFEKNAFEVIIIFFSNCTTKTIYGDFHLVYMNERRYRMYKNECPLLHYFCPANFYYNLCTSLKSNSNYNRIFHLFNLHSFVLFTFFIC